MSWQRFAAELILLLGASSIAFGAELAQPIRWVTPVRPLPSFIEEIVIEFLPSQMSPTENNDEARRQFESGVTKKVGEDLFQSSLFSKNGFGKLVKDVKGFTTRSLEVGSSAHFSIDASKTRATFNFSGPVGSDLSYLGRDHTVQWLISKNLSPNTLVSLKEEWCFSAWNATTSMLLGYKF